MFWLFGEIWVWLIVSFALGAVTTWLVMRARTHAPEAAAPEPYPAYEPLPLAAEETQYIPATHEPEYDDYPEYHHKAIDDEPYDQEADGHREGHLPMPPPRPARDDYWPGAEQQPAWPESEEAGQQQWRQPGRGG
jgi:hypothetical protein